MNNSKMSLKTKNIDKKYQSPIPYPLPNKKNKKKSFLNKYFELNQII